MRNLVCCLFTFLLMDFAVHAQAPMTDAERIAKKDSTLKAAMHADSVRIEKEFSEQEKWDHLFAKLTYPKISEARFGGVLPVDNPTETPDPNIEYKLLFELTKSNPDSMAKEVNASLAEVARIINLHVASGIPLKKISPVVVVHGPALSALTNSEAFHQKFKTDNPNLKLLDELRSAGAKFIACGQAMQFFEIPRQSLLPDVKVSLTAQTVLSGYQLKGFVLYAIDPM